MTQESKRGKYSIAERCGTIQWLASVRVRWLLWKCPILGSARRKIVDDGVTGFLFEPGNAEGLEEKMKLLREDPDLCRQMGKAGREKAIREYSMKVYYNRLMTVYKKSLDLNIRNN